MRSIKRLGVAVADRFFLLRPLVIIPALTFFLLGYCQASSKRGADSGTFSLAIVAYAILMGSIYIINQLTDVESDAANDKLFLLPRGIIKKREAHVWAVILVGLSMGAALKIGGAIPWVFGLSFIMGVAYSVPPFALKRRFPLDILWNAVGYGIVAYVAGRSVVSNPGLADLKAASPFAFCVGGVFILTALADKEGDQKSGFKSTGVVFSLRAGVGGAGILLAAALALGIVTHNAIAAVGAAFSLPFFAYALLRTGSQSVKVAYRCSSAVFILIVGLIRPLFLIVVLVLLGLSRIYYSKRFLLDYPSVAGK